MSETDFIESDKYIKWPFKEDDWLINLIFSNPIFLSKIMTLRDYNLKNIDILVLELLEVIKNYREEKQEENVSFIKKKKYLKDNVNNKKIQITIEDEIEIKINIEKYKIYSLIYWIHMFRNEKISNHCMMQRYNILDLIYPKIQLSIRKVIGSKVYDPTNIEFEEAVNNAWVSIIKYMTKIDTTKVMFSIFIATAHRSALYMKSLNNHNNYHVQTISTYKYYNHLNDFDDDCILNYKNHQLEDDEETLETLLIDKIDNDYEDQLEEIESNHADQLSTLKSNILSYSFTILSLSKKPSIQKILAEFFIDMINKNLSKEIIERNATTIINTMDMNYCTINQINNDTNNQKFYKLFRDFLQFKIRLKVEKFTNLQISNESSPTSKKENKRISKTPYYLELTKKERELMKYLLSNKENIISELMIFRENCLKYNRN